jgi:AraC family transcriptional regulator
MASAILLIRNMVCHRCVLSVEDILQKEAIPYEKVVIGGIHMNEDLSPEKKERLIKKLAVVGFELINNQSTALIEKIKVQIIKRVHALDGEKETNIKLSHYLSAKLNYEYTYLSSLFSSVEGRTIENYYIEQRIEKAKELLVYGQLTLSQIAFDLEYSSVAHLSAHCKKITGLTPTHFKKIGLNKRKGLDKI